MFKFFLVATIMFGHVCVLRACESLAFQTLQGNVLCQNVAMQSVGQEAEQHSVASHEGVLSRLRERRKQRRVFSKYLRSQEKQNILFSKDRVRKDRKKKALFFSREKRNLAPRGNAFLMLDSPCPQVRQSVVGSYEGSEGLLPTPAG